MGLNYIQKLQIKLKMEKLPYRVLQVVTIMNRGGIETMIMNHYRAIDRTKIQFDFLVHRQDRGDYDDEIDQLGGRIYRAFPIRPWKYIQYFKWLKDFFHQHHNYIAVHSHIHENSGFVFKYANLYNIKNLLCTSHIAIKFIVFKIIFRLYAKYYLNKYCSKRLACGDMAGKYLYGNKSFTVIKNAINTSDFVFNKNIRNQIRAELGITNNFVIGNVARFSPQKNHKFILNLFKEFLSIDNNAILVLVGGGENEKDIKELAVQYGISGNIKFLGLRKDINRLLQSFDIFLFPSLYEGLPVSIIEAQAAGLPCILSDTIDSETAITSNVEFHSLNAPISEWTNAILDKKTFRRVDTTSEIVDAGYDVIQNAKLLYRLYTQKG